MVNNISVSSDLFHYSDLISRQARHAAAAAEAFGISVGTISVARPEETNVAAASGQLPEGLSGVMYRGRAVEKLAGRVEHAAWEQFSACPHEKPA